MLASLAGCAWFGGSEGVKIAPLPEFVPSAQAAVAWRIGLAKGGRQTLRPAVVGERVYAVSSAGEVIALDAGSGRQLWRSQLKQTISAGVGATDGIVLVGTNKGEVVALDDNGKERWRSALNTEALSPPRAAGETVVARSGDGSVFALAQADGKRIWSQQRTPPALTLRELGAPAIAEGNVYAGFPGGKLVAMSLEAGAQLWEASVSVPRGATELERIADVAAEPLLVDEQVCAVAYQGKLACYGTAKGNLEWARELSSARTLARDARNVYAVDDRGMVLAFTRLSGTSLWRQDKLENRKVTGPAVSGDRLAVGDFEGYVHILSTEDGRFLARVPTDGGAIVAEPVIAAGRFVVQTTKGGVFAIAVQ